MHIQKELEYNCHGLRPGLFSEARSHIAHLLLPPEVSNSKEDVLSAEDRGELRASSSFWKRAITSASWDHCTEGEVDGKGQKKCLKCQKSFSINCSTFKQRLDQKKQGHFLNDFSQGTLSLDGNVTEAVLLPRQEHSLSKFSCLASETKILEAREIHSGCI